MGVSGVTRSFTCTRVHRVRGRVLLLRTALDVPWAAAAEGSHVTPAEAAIQSMLSGLKKSVELGRRSHLLQEVRVGDHATGTVVQLDGHVDGARHVPKSVLFRRPAVGWGHVSVTEREKTGACRSARAAPPQTLAATAAAFGSGKELAAP